MASIAVYSNPLRNKSQEYLLRTLGEASSRLQTTFHKFVDEQIKAIEDTKVKIKKRKGVIGFIRIFPHFSMAIENIFVTVTKESGLNTSVLEIRKLVDDAYERIAAAMWSSLKHIAKDTPATAGLANGSGIDAEDKETLNHEILLVENFNHFALELDVGEMANGTLDKLRSMALGEREEHLGQYLRRVIRRPLGKLLVSMSASLSIYAYFNRNSSSLQKSWSSKTHCHQQKSSQNHLTRAALQRKHYRRMTAARSEKASKRYGNESRSTLVKATQTKPWRRNWCSSSLASVRTSI